MIYLFLAFLAIYTAWEIAHSKFKDDELGKWAVRMLVILGAVFFIYWAYLYVVLPFWVHEFYNAGAGLTFSGGSKNLTVYNSTDEAVLFYAAGTHQDWVLVSNLRDGFELLAGVLLGVYFLWWMMGHNILGATIKRPPGGAIQAMRRAGGAGE